MQYTGSGRKSMFTCKEYRRAATLEEAWQMNQKRSNLLIGGMLWVKMGHRNAGTVIDLSELGLDQIEETPEEFRIGCMTTLRQLEEHEGLNAYTNGAIRESVRHIVGVQFRNSATVGGSIFGRFGFSDVLTMMLAMDSYVELYKGGILPMSEFVDLKRDRDILVRVIIKKKEGRFAYQSMRNAKTDFPVLAVAAAHMDGKLYLSIGARPMRAVRLEIDAQSPVQGEATKASGKDIEDAAMGADSVRISPEDAKRIGEYAAANVTVGSNLRGSASYRRELIKTLVKRACLSL